jgi:hypothetical protein
VKILEWVSLILKELFYTKLRLYRTLTNIRRVLLENAKIFSFEKNDEKVEIFGNA